MPDEPTKRPTRAKLRDTLDRWHADLSDDEKSTIGSAAKEDLTGRLGQRELQKGLRFLFFGLGKVPWIQSDAEWTDAEFEDESKAIVDLVNRFPPLRVVVRLLGPISSVAGFFDKWKKLMDHRAPKGERAPTPIWPWQKKKAAAKPEPMFGKENMSA